MRDSGIIRVPAMRLLGPLSWIKLRFGWRPIVWGAVLAVLAAILDGLPLVNLLGFDFCFVLGLVTAFAGVDIGHGTVTAARQRHAGATAAGLVARAVAASLGVLVLPLLLSLGNAVRVRNCNLGAGLVFFLLLPAATAIYAAGTGALLAIAVPRPRLSRGLAFALPLLSIAWALLRLYRDPAVFAYDPYAGYFPGPIYDEALRPPLRLLWFRLANLTWLFTLAAVADWLRDDGQATMRLRLGGWRPLVARSGRALGVLVLVIASVLWLANRERLGFLTTSASLAKLLPRETRSPHFVLYSDPALESDSDIALAQDDLEFRYSQLEGILGVEPVLPITVYRFPSSASKKEAVGAATTLFAKPWRRQLFVQADRFPAQRLRHEMAHVFASAFGDPVFGVALAWHFVGPFPVPRLATGLIEGVAEAADFDNPDGRLTLHEEAAAMIALGKAPRLERVLGAGFSLESGPRAYTIAGSFCRFLLDRFGAAKLRAAYRSAGDFQRVYGVPLATLAEAWRADLARLGVDAQSRAEAEEEFRRPAIFGKVCARELAARVAEARARLGTAPAQAALLLASACSDDPGEPIYRIDLAEADFAAGQTARALATLADAELPTRALRYRAASLAASIHFHTGDLAACEPDLRQALANATDDADERAALAKLRSLADPPSRRTLGRVLFGDERGRPLDPGLVVFLLTEFERAAPGDALGPYLLARQLATRDPALASTAFAQACPLDPPGPAAPLDAVFLKECRWQWAQAAYLTGDLDAARRATRWLLTHAPRKADELRAQDMANRIAWKSLR